MRTNPANKQMNLRVTEGVLAYHSVAVAANIENYLVRTVAQKICASKSAFNICRIEPIGKSDFFKPCPENITAVRVEINKQFYAPFFYQMYLHTNIGLYLSSPNENFKWLTRCANYFLYLDNWLFILFISGIKNHCGELV